MTVMLIWSKIKKKLFFFIKGTILTYLIEDDGYSSEQVKHINVEVSIDGINRLRKM